MRRLLASCLEKEPKLRLQAIGDWRLLLDEASAPPEATVAQRPAGGLAAWAVAGVLMMALGALALVHFRETPPETPILRSTLLPPDDVTLDFTNGLGLPALSPDGRKLVFGARTADGKVPLWLRSLDSMAAQPLLGTDGAHFPFWSPDSRYIAFFANDKLMKVDIAGGAPMTITHTPTAPARGGSWGSAGAIVFAASTATNPTSALQRVAATGGTATPIQKAPGRMPWFLPDGKHFLSFVASGGVAEIRAASLDGGDSKKITAADTNAVYTQGHLVFVRDGTLVAQPFDAARLAVTGEAVALGEEVQSILNSGTVGVLSVSQTGLLAYRTGTVAGYQLTWLDRSGKLLPSDRSQTPTRGAFRDVAISPDGARAAVEHFETTAGHGNPFDIWLIEANGARTRFTSDPAADVIPVWSPDGKRIVFASDRGGSILNLYIKDAAGGRAEELLLQSPETKFPQDWSTDGRFLLYTVSGEGPPVHLWVLPMSGEDRKPRPYLQTAFSESQARFSPDGRWVAYASNESGRREVYVRPFPDAAGGKTMVSRNGGGAPHWRRDGKELFYVSNDSKMMAVEVTTGTAFRTGTPVPLFTAPIRAAGGGSVSRYDVTPDGQRFLFAAESTVTDGARPSPFTLVQNWVSGLKK